MSAATETAQRSGMLSSPWRDPDPARHLEVRGTAASSRSPDSLIDADGFLRGALLEGAAFSPPRHCHRPLVVRDPATRLGHLLHRLCVEPSTSEDDVIDRDLILLWTASDRRVLTGADILGRLLRGIARRGPMAPTSEIGEVGTQRAHVNRQGARPAARAGPAGD